MAVSIPARGPASVITGFVVPRTVNLGVRLRDQVKWLGELLLFVARVVGSIPLVMRHYRREVWRLLAEVTVEPMEETRRDSPVAGKTVLVS